MPQWCSFIPTDSIEGVGSSVLQVSVWMGRWEAAQVRGSACIGVGQELLEPSSQLFQHVGLDLSDMRRVC